MRWHGSEQLSQRVEPGVPGWGYPFRGLSFGKRHFESALVRDPQSGFVLTGCCLLKKESGQGRVRKQGVPHRLGLVSGLLQPTQAVYFCGPCP